jgi:hypothetical protein
VTAKQQCAVRRSAVRSTYAGGARGRSRRALRSFSLDMIARLERLLNAGVVIQRGRSSSERNCQMRSDWRARRASHTVAIRFWQCVGVLIGQ